ncbi:MAG TPA: adenylyltransferase/cytidyltransferase family protein [Candidatus Nanoarchaeia archaeon]|nr:adenylyltransferase/cytidyltransferase family protein [Candidatus Nanoarchaeia archaeon]
MVIKRTKKAVCFGTFDMIHDGHLNFFQQAKEKSGPGSRLVVVVARDINVEKAKGRKPAHNEEQRLKAVKSIAMVDEAVLGDYGDRLKIIEKLKPGMICLGYDQEAPGNLEESLNKRGIKAEIVRLKPYMEDKFKSSKIKQRHKLYKS